MKFLSILGILVVGLVAILLINKVEDNTEPLKFEIGEMIQTKVGQRVGQIITVWTSTKKYSIRFQNDSNLGVIFQTNIMREFELEKCSGSRC